MSHTPIDQQAGSQVKYWCYKEDSDSESEPMDPDLLMLSSLGYTLRLCESLPALTAVLKSKGCLDNFHISSYRLYDEAFVLTKEEIVHELHAIKQCLDVLKESYNADSDLSDYYENAAGFFERSYDYWCKDEKKETTTS